MYVQVRIEERNIAQVEIDKSVYGIKTTEAVELCEKKNKDINDVIQDKNELLLRQLQARDDEFASTLLTLEKMR
jgi:hypothetical protein